MLLCFSVENFAQFNGKMVLQMLPNKKMHSESEQYLQNILMVGPNGGGKSRFLNALEFGKWFVTNDHYCHSYMLRVPEGKFAQFQYDLLLDGQVYTYFFALDTCHVDYECLKYDNGDIIFEHFADGSNRSILGKSDRPEAAMVLDWFKRMRKDEDSVQTHVMLSDPWVFEKFKALGVNDPKIAEILYHLKVLQDGSLFLIDDLGTGLHPVLANTLFEFIMGVCEDKNCQVVATTHVDHLIDSCYLQNDELCIITNDKITAFDHYKDVPTERRRDYYLSGRLRGIPIVFL